jgi:hypothetical protein
VLIRGDFEVFHPAVVRVTSIAETLVCQTPTCTDLLSHHHPAWLS